MSIWGVARLSRTGVAIIIALLSNRALEANAAYTWKNFVKADPEIIGYGLGMVAGTSARCGRYVIWVGISAKPSTYSLSLELKANI